MTKLSSNWKDPGKGLPGRSALKLLALLAVGANPPADAWGLRSVSLAARSSSAAVHFQPRCV